jgi:polar amino acid transport system substrate-binding protein
MPVLIAVLLAAMTFSASAQQGTETVRGLTVTVGANHAPPYRVIESGPPTGLYVEIFREITDRLGWKTHRCA